MAPPHRRQRASDPKLSQNHPGIAVAGAKALALRVLAERLEHGEPTVELDGLFEAA